MKNQVWIELEKPTSDDHATDIVTLANNMLHRLNGKEPTSIFWWDNREHCYCYGGENGYVTLSDRGHWFNLEYLGRPI